MTRWICPEEAESVADAKRRLAKRSGTNTRDDGEAVAFNIDEIMLEAERRHHEWNRPGVTGQTVRPEQAIEYWYALVAHEKAAATLSRQLAEANNRAMLAEEQLTECKMALEQAIDDFGDGHCVCEETKQLCIAALRDPDRQARR